MSRANFIGRGSARVIDLCSFCKERAVIVAEDSDGNELLCCACTRSSYGSDDPRAVAAFTAVLPYSHDFGQRAVLPFPSAARRRKDQM